MKEKFNIDSDSKEYKNLEWSGFFSNKKIQESNSNPSKILLNILKDKWTLVEDDIDLIVMYHSFIIQEDYKEKKIISFLSVEGEDSTYTAMSKTVGLPIALLIEYIIQSNKTFLGINLPFDEEVYLPILSKLEKLDIRFEEREIST